MQIGYFRKGGKKDAGDNGNSMPLDCLEQTRRMEEYMSTKAFEVESGVAVNEPVNYAVRTAIEYCLLEILKLGDKEELWEIKY